MVMDKNSAKKVVKIISWAYIISPIAFIINVILVTFMAFISLLNWDNDPISFPLLIGMYFFIFLHGAVCFVSGIYLRKFREWARISSIVCAALLLLYIPIGTIIGAVVINYLAFNTTIKKMFQKP